MKAVRADIQAVRDRDPACKSYSEPLLYFKGLHALQSYRVSHWLWEQGRHALALYLQNQISESFGVDIHPAARIGSGILIDHGWAVVSGYFHLSSIEVEAEQQVEPGDIIGRVGSTGLSTGDHLHWEIRVRGVPVNPEQWTQEALP